MPPTASTPQGSFENLLHARGFTLTRELRTPRHKHWRVGDVGGWSLAYDPLVGFTQAAAGRASVSVLGLVIDTDTWSGARETVQRAASALAQGEEQFLDVVDAWAGRHLIVWSRERSVSVMTDATGMRTCFYNLEGELRLASHASLAAELSDAVPADIGFTERLRFTRGVRYFPGRITPWQGIVFLTPNTALDLHTRELRRVWPRRTLPGRSIEAAADALADRLPGQMRWLNSSHHPVAVSLTGGIDTRVTLAACRPVAKHLSFFTYRLPGNDAHEADVRIASQIADVVGLEHTELVVTPDAGPDGAVRKRALDANSFLSRYRAEPDIYREVYSPQTIHVRSNVAEVGRYFFDKGGKGVRIERSRHLARVWKRMPHVPECVAAFKDWTEAIGFWDVSEIELLDLFYWEHRMPCWHGCVVLESDIAFESHALFNCRVVLEILLSVPVEARREGRVFSSFIDRQWPELARFKIA